jgi:hypothetical protein
MWVLSRGWNDHVMAMDFDPDITGIASQPFWLCWRGEDGSKDPEALIDILVPAYTSRARENVQVAEDLVTTEVPGLDQRILRAVARWTRTRPGPALGFKESLQGSPPSRPRCW